ncbi:MAG: gamma-glutamyltransferase family protein [Thermoanaerobaculales bacterium]|jgi:gamma-glutamyltranspeptidase/glutathione hydrolase|nr:gamma-glutamyltransferase family protein [Thermoanaerobaculales bacterium]
MQRTALVLMIALVSSGIAMAADRPVGHSFATRSVVHAQHGMVAAAHPLAVEIGLGVLKDGGSAVDAAIAVNAALGFMEPVSCGLGGDLFAMVWDPETETLRGLNASGRAPRALTADKVPAEPDGTIPVYSPYAWTVPGCADGWFALHERFGKLPMKRLLEPTITAARKGAPVPRVIAGSWARGAAKFKDMPGFAQVFMPGGKVPAEGELFANPALADTLERMASGGREAFYGGETGEALVAFSDKVGGFFSLEDLTEHSSDWVEPVSTTYRGHTVWELPPNGQGIAALQILNLIEGFDVASMGRDSADFWHLLVEAKKIAYEDRARFYADIDFNQLPIAELISKPYAAERAKLIDMTRAAKSIPPGNPGLGHGDTTFLVAADASGQMVSLIQSNYTGFGSGYVVPELGFGIQDRGALFNLAEGHPNFLEPGKRPFHTIIPAFFGAGDTPDMAFGVMGGDMQPQGHVQIVVNMVDFGMDLQEAGDAARFHHTDSSEPTGTVMTDGGVLHLESGVSAEIKRELMRRGHHIEEITPVVFGGYQAIRLNPATGVYAGATESRKDGMAAGY